MESAAILNHIKAYCEGQLSTEEQNDFNKELANNPEYQSAYESYLASQKVLDLMTLKSLKTTLKETIENKKTAKKIGLVPNWLKIAASVIILVLANTFIFRQDIPSNLALADQAYINPLSIFPELSSTRGADASSATWTVVLVNFQNGQYQKVINNLEQSTKLHPLHDFILANAYFKENQNDKAILLLASFTSDKSAYMEAAKWLKTLVLLKQNKDQDELTNLNKIIAQEPTSIFHTNAQDLLSQLKK